MKQEKNFLKIIPKMKKSKKKAPLKTALFFLRKLKI